MDEDTMDHCESCGTDPDRFEGDLGPLYHIMVVDRPPFN